jgi:hypothetical protein
MATPDTATAVVETAADTSKIITIFEHVKQNNVAYLIAIFVSHQLGILDQVITFGTGMC